MRITRSATRSASCSAGSPGSPIARFSDARARAGDSVRILLRSKPNPAEAAAFSFAHESHFRCTTGWLGGPLSFVPSAAHASHLRWTTGPTEPSTSGDLNGDPASALCTGVAPAEAGRCSGGAKVRLIGADSSSSHDDGVAASRYMLVHARGTRHPVAEALGTEARTRARHAATCATSGVDVAEYHFGRPRLQLHGEVASRDHPRASG
jgi:hypothetical protein